LASFVFDPSNLFGTILIVIVIYLSSARWRAVLGRRLTSVNV